MKEKLNLLSAAIIEVNKSAIIRMVIIICAVIVAIAVAFIVCEFVLKRQKSKKHIKDLDKKFCYLKSLLSGQDAQNVRRLEVISRSNLLYGEIYERFSNEFKTILEEFCKPAEAAIVKVRSIINKKEYNHFKGPYAYAKKLVAQFEDKVLVFDKNLYNTLKPEEDSRSDSVKVKEDYRNIKQKFSNFEKELALVAPTFEKTFEKIDSAFDKYEMLLECADYEEAQDLIKKITQVVGALTHAVNELPNLCSQIDKVIPEKMMLLGNDFIDVEKSGIPLFHLAYKTRLEAWKIEVESVRSGLKELKISGAQSRLDAVIKEIDSVHKQLEQEVMNKKFFEENVSTAYDKVIILEKDFLKIVAKLPEVNEIYVVSPTQQNNLEALKVNINDLGGAKRSLDNFIHSATKQPYSILRSKLEQLINDYEVAKKGVDDFKAYIESIKGNSEDAYNLVFNYYYRLKKTESMIRDMHMSNMQDRYEEAIERCYSLLNQIDVAVKTKPIDVKYVNEKVEELKSVSNVLFDDVDKQISDMKLAESAIVYDNQDRLHQSEVHAKLLAVEKDFYNGEFTKVYRTANDIYLNSHVEDNK